MEGLSVDHPKQKLAFFISQEVDLDLLQQVQCFLAALASSRSWTIAPPQFVNVREEPNDKYSNDSPLQTVGGYLELYSALPPWTLPRDIDIKHLEEVLYLVDSLCRFSRDRRVGFELELDGTFIGAIDGGQMDRGVADVFLGEWRRHLEANGDSLSR